MASATSTNKRQQQQMLKLEYYYDEQDKTYYFGISHGTTNSIEGLYKEDIEYLFRDIAHRLGYTVIASPDVGPGPKGMPKPKYLTQDEHYNDIYVIQKTLDEHSETLECCVRTIDEQLFATITKMQKKIDKLGRQFKTNK